MKKGMQMKTGLALALPMAVALALAACGDKKPDAGQATRASATAAAAPVDESVAAVRVSTGDVPAQLRFVLGSRPEPGKSFTLKLSAMAAAPVPELLLDLESPGMALSPASARIAIADASAIAQLDVTATPAAAGLTEVLVRMRAGPEAPETRYAIPVLVVEPAAAEAAAPASDKADPAPAGNHPNP